MRKSIEITIDNELLAIADNIILYSQINEPKAEKIKKQFADRIIKIIFNQKIYEQ